MGSVSQWWVWVYRSGTAAIGVHEMAIGVSLPSARLHGAVFCAFEIGIDDQLVILASYNRDAGVLERLPCPAGDAASLFAIDLGVKFGRS